MSEAGRGRLSTDVLGTGEASRNCAEPSSNATAACAGGAAGAGASAGRAGAEASGGGAGERAARRAGGSISDAPGAGRAGREWVRRPAFLRLMRAAVSGMNAEASFVFATRTGTGGGVCTVPMPCGKPCSSSAPRAKLAAQMPPAHGAERGKRRGLAVNRFCTPGHSGAGSRARRGSVSAMLWAAARRNWATAARTRWASDANAGSRASCASRWAVRASSSVPSA